MEQPVVYVFTHDSVWVGEDGPTHQPVEHTLALRAIPNLVVLRPADGNETAAAWRVALERTAGPTALLLSRQGLPVLEGTEGRADEGAARGRGGRALRVHRRRSVWRCARDRAHCHRR
jgi:transketolase